MTINKKIYIQKQFEDSEEWSFVLEIANDLFDYLSIPEVIQKINAVNIPGRSSIEIQDVLLKKVKEIGFKDESENLFKNSPNKRLRPDFYLPFKNTGIIIEVERGKTNINNMDFLDFWKCHICDVAHYLFLIVPNELVQNDTTGSRSYPYKTVNSHMSSFFEEKNYTNVRGLVVFGY